MELLLGYEILESYKRLSYKEWYALAEFIDNSTQSYRNYKAQLDPEFEKSGQGLTVSIKYNNSKPNDFLSIEDNAYGMSLEELKRALILGKKPQNDKERSKYGLGLKTASFWFGDTWTISTTQLGLDQRFSVTIDLLEILKAEKVHNEKEKDIPEIARTRFVPQLKFEADTSDVNEHGTKVLITSLNRKITAAKARKCKAFLRSIYRVDLTTNRLHLFFQDDEITWSKDEILNSLYVDKKTGDKMYRVIEDLQVGEHIVTGWAGILKKGNRQNAGFSLLQAERVIQGSPDSYRPSSLFGDQEGGTNNLINQRLIGELYLDGFEVSHTKNEILFQDDEEELLDQALLERLGDYKQYAEDLRVTDIAEEPAIDFNEVTKLVVQNLNSPNFRSAVHKKEVLPLEIIEKTNDEVFSRLSGTDNNAFTVHINQLVVTVIISEVASPYDPYILIHARAEENSLIVILNKQHSYYRELNTKETVYEFIKNCVYDGIAEWKAYFLVKSLHPDTIKTIKDHLLRVPADFPF